MILADSSPSFQLISAHCIHPTISNQFTFRNGDPLPIPAGRGPMWIHFPQEMILKTRCRRSLLAKAKDAGRPTLKNSTDEHGEKEGPWHSSTFNAWPIRKPMHLTYRWAKSRNKYIMTPKANDSLTSRYWWYLIILWLRHSLRDILVFYLSAAVR